MEKMYKINGNPENFADLQVFHKLAKQFIPYAQKKMGFDRPVGINLISDPENAKNPLGKTAHYDPNKLEVTVFVDKRHVKDILRSMSHELVHHTQNCRGDLENRPTGPGYAQEDGHMREMERQAYEEGQMVLRDFEDNLKKENQKMSESKEILLIKKLIKEELAEGLPGMIDEVSDEVKARTAPRDKANRGDFLPKNVRDEINAEEGGKKEELEEGQKCPHCDGGESKSKCICGKDSKGKKSKKCPVCKQVKCEAGCNEGQVNEEKDEPRGEDEGAGVGTKPPKGSKRTAPGEDEDDEEKPEERGVTMDEQIGAPKDDKAKLAYNKNMLKQRKKNNPDGDHSKLENEIKELEKKIKDKKTNENWTKKNKDQLLFERLVKKWTK